MDIAVYRSAPPGWDEWLSDLGPKAAFTQTSEWASIDSAVNGSTPLYIEAVRSGIRVGGLQVSARPVRSGLTSTLFGRRNCALLIHGGPALLEADQAVMDGLIRALLSVADDLGAWRVDLAGPPAHSSMSDDARFRLAAENLGFASSEWGTFLVPLAESEEEILIRCAASVRKNIRKASRSDVRVQVAEDFHDYEKFVQEFFAARGDRTSSRRIAEHLRAWDKTSPERYKYLLARSAEGKVLATLGTYRFAGVATEIMSAQTRFGREQVIPAQDVLHWHALRLHRQMGDVWFDLAGFNPAPSSSSEVGIRRFKAKWGGIEVRTMKFSKDMRSWLPKLVGDRSSRLRSLVSPRGRLS